MVEFTERPKAMTSPVFFEKIEDGRFQVTVILDMEADDVEEAAEIIKKQILQYKIRKVH